MLPESGQIVRARSRQYLVEQVVAPPMPGDDTLVRMACLDDDAQGEALDVLWEREVDAEIITGSSWARVAERGFDPPRTFGAYLHTLRWSGVSSTNPKLFQAPYRAGIEVLAYQLEPLRKALLLPFVNLFIADDVGLGKTIEAGLVMRELMMRQKVRRIVVAAPPSVVFQWRDELERRFGLSFVVYDRDYLAQKRRERGYGVNPFTTHTRFIISHALLRDETHSGLLRDWITNDDHLRPEFREPALLVLDEAHNAAPASGGKYAIDSKFTHAVRDLAPLFEHRLFLSATPHNGHSNSFSALLEILDPHRFCRGVKVAPRYLDAVMVRRLKADLREVGTGIPVRKVVQIDIDGLPENAPELVLARLLDEYRQVREAKVKDATKRARNAALIVLTALQKRLLSSIEAFACTLRVHRRAVDRAHATGNVKELRIELTPTLFDAPDADDERGALPEEELRAEQEVEFELATEAAMGAGALEARESEVLSRMADVAESSRGVPDPRLLKLMDWIRANCLEANGRSWNERRLLIFTEYTDTKRYLDEQLRTLLARTDRIDERIDTFHGGMDDERREEVKRAFNANPEKHPLRILIATDAGREGLNFQNHCADLFHFDVPWNPSRMEQRNGRIDRKGQRSPEVRCHYFVFTQRPEDRVLEALVRKTQNIQAELGSLSQVLEARLARILEGGIRRVEAEGLAARIGDEKLEGERAEVVDEELERATRARQQLLVQQMSGLRDMMASAREALGFDEGAFREALSASLELLGAEPLVAVPAQPGVYALPLENVRLAKDPTWAETLDTLRAPRGRDEKLWEWRKSSPIRPVVFQDVGSLDEDFVHLHLEHRLVQRLLGRFLAQGFVHDDLARACVVLSSDPLPRVVLLGRLSLYGERASRLHDEILAVAARWVDPTTRTDSLRPYSDDAKAKALDLVEKALADGRSVGSVIAKKLAAEVDRDLRELTSPLGALGDERARRAMDQLFSRGEREAREIVEVLEAQTKRIREMLTTADTPQLTLGFSDDERRQLEADQRHWKKRVTSLEEDLASEPARIRRSYEVRAQRVDPIGIIYLWPVTG
jgi:ERCC4-related helicase